MSVISTKVKRALPKQLSINKLLHEALEKLAMPRKGVSFISIKKYIEANHPDFDLDRKLHYLKKALKSGIVKAGKQRVIV